MNSEIIDKEQLEKENIINRLRKKRLESIEKPTVTELIKTQNRIEEFNDHNLKLVTTRKIPMGDLTTEEKEQYKIDLIEFKKNNKWEYKKSIDFLINNIISKRKDNPELTVLERKELARKIVKPGIDGWGRILILGHSHETYDEFNIPRLKSEVIGYLENNPINTEEND